jgi:hypothetical protein
VRRKGVKEERRRKGVRSIYWVIQEEEVRRYAGRGRTNPTHAGRW